MVVYRGCWLGSLFLMVADMNRTDAERFESWVMSLMIGDHMTREQAEQEVLLSMLVEEAQARGAYDIDRASQAVPSLPS